MNREDIIRMARGADEGFETDTFHEESLVGMDAIERFAALVAAAERKACAKVVEELPMYGPDDETADWYGLALVDCAAAIRARGQE